MSFHLCHILDCFDRAWPCFIGGVLVTQFRMVSALAALSGHPWHHRISLVACCSLASALSLRCSRQWASPAARAAVALPALAFNVVAPTLFDRDSEGVTIAFVAFLLTWLASFKTVAWVLGRGPLAARQLTLLQLFVLYSLPLVARPRPSQLHRRRWHEESPGPPIVMFLRWMLKAALAAAVVFSLMSEELPRWARSCLYSLGIYSMLGVFMDGPAALLLQPLALELAPHFLPPWHSASLADFWGSRWNQAASSALRTTIYEPLVEGQLVAGSGHATHAGSPPASSSVEARLIDAQELLAAGPASSDGTSVSSGARRRSARLAAAAAAAAAASPAAAARAGPAAAAPAEAEGGLKGGAGAGIGGRSSGKSSVGGGSSRARRLVGMAACFAASGAAHEIIFFYIQGSFTHCASWLCFFLVQAPLILAERVLLEKAPERWGFQLPKFVRSGIVLAVLLVSAHWLFYLPAEQAGVPARFAASMRQTFTAVAAAPSQLLGW